MPEGVDIVELAAEQGPVESIEDLVSRQEMSRIVADGTVAAVIEQTQTTSLEEAFIYLSELPAQEVAHVE